MKAEKMNQMENVSRVRQAAEISNALQMKDNREMTVLQAKMKETIQRQEFGDEEDEEDLIQGKFENKTGIPTEVKQRMEDSFSADFSSVRVHPDSTKAPEVGALAFTQGTDIHFAPGQFKPDTSAGRQLLGHELTHVVQQSKGLVQPTGEINGLPVNDNVALEHEADVQGLKAAW